MTPARQVLFLAGGSVEDPCFLLGVSQPWVKLTWNLLFPRQSAQIHKLTFQFFLRYVQGEQTVLKRLGGGVPLSLAMDLGRWILQDHLVPHSDAHGTSSIVQAPA